MNNNRITNIRFSGAGKLMNRCGGGCMNQAEDETTTRGGGAARAAGELTEQEKMAIRKERRASNINDFTTIGIISGVLVTGWVVNRFLL